VSGQDINTFNYLLNQCNLSLTIPTDAIECTVIDNKDVEYHYAVRHPDKPFEVRYTIAPITLRAYPNDSIRKEMESQRAYRNASYLPAMKAIILNITGGVGTKITEFDPAEAQVEFNADWGATAFVELNSDFGKGYKYCMIISLHKKDVADVYYFYLSVTRDNFRENAHPFFHSLLFD
jgi:hypothetical protein